jgi:hypothetical protein
MMDDAPAGDGRVRLCRFRALSQRKVIERELGRDRLDLHQITMIFE